MQNTVDDLLGILDLNLDFDIGRNSRPKDVKHGADGPFFLVEDGYADFGNSLRLYDGSSARTYMEDTSDSPQIIKSSFKNGERSNENGHVI